MKKLSVLIMGVTLLIAFLWATTGITVYSHYCPESKSVNKSLFIEDADCEHHEEDLAMESCCEEKKSCHTEETESDCCATQKQVFKLASIFTIPGEKQQVKIIDFKLFEYNEIPIDENVVLVENYNTQNESPPGIYGKILLITIHQQKIAPAPLV